MNLPLSITSQKLDSVKFQKIRIRMKRRFPRDSQIFLDNTATTSGYIDNNIELEDSLVIDEDIVALGYLTEDDILKVVTYTQL